MRIGIDAREEQAEADGVSGGAGDHLATAEIGPTAKPDGAGAVSEEENDAAHLAELLGKVAQDVIIHGIRSL